MGKFKLCAPFRAYRPTEANIDIKNQIGSPKINDLKTILIHGRLFGLFCFTNYLNAGIPVISWPRIKVCISWVPS